MRVKRPMFIPHKTWKMRPSALLYYWRRKGWIQDISEIDNIVRYAHGVDVNAVKAQRVPLLTAKEYSLKYNLPRCTPYRLFKKGKVAGVIIGGKILIVDKPPPASSRKRVDLSVVINKVETLGIRGMGARAVALIQLPYMIIKQSAYTHGARAILNEYRKQGRLYRIKRSYYVLFSRIGILSKDELKALYPDPSEIVVPKRRNISWEMIEYLGK